jgi:hypothetical protein
MYIMYVKALFKMTPYFEALVTTGSTERFKIRCDWGQSQMISALVILL